MKKLLLFVLTSVLLISCDIKEELYLKKNGKGNINYQVDYSKMLSFVSVMAKNSKSPNELEKKIDTVIYFSDFVDKMKDSIPHMSKEDQQVLSEMKNYEMKLLMDMKNNKGTLAVTSNFNKVGDINHLEEILKKGSFSFRMKTGKIAKVEKYSFGYELNKKKFKRFVIENKLSDKEELEYQKYVVSNKMILSGSNYKILYHFDRKIKSTSNKDALITDNKKTLEISYPMDTLISNPYLLEFEVNLK